MQKPMAPKGIARATTMRAAVTGPSPSQAHPSHPQSAKRSTKRG